MFKEQSRKQQQTSNSLKFSIASLLFNDGNNNRLSAAIDRQQTNLLQATLSRPSLVQMNSSRSHPFSMTAATPASLLNYYEDVHRNHSSSSSSSQLSSPQRNSISSLQCAPTMPSSSPIIPTVAGHLDYHNESSCSSSSSSGEHLSCSYDEQPPSAPSSILRRHPAVVASSTTSLASNPLLANSNHQTALCAMMMMQGGLLALSHTPSVHNSSAVQPAEPSSPSLSPIKRSAQAAKPNQFLQSQLDKMSSFHVQPHRSHQAMATQASGQSSSESLDDGVDMSARTDRLKSGVKRKRVRTIFTNEQLDELELRFERQQYMVGAERQALAGVLNLTEAQVKVWFQNRRIKHRNLNKRPPPE